MPVKTRSKTFPKPKFEAWVTDVVTRLASELNLYDWRIGVSFDEEDDEPNCTAFTSLDPRYLISHICFTPCAREFWDENAMVPLIEAVVHEMTHILLEPLHQFAKRAASPQTAPQLTDILEQTNQRLARIVIEQLPPKFFAR